MTERTPPLGIPVLPVDEYEEMWHGLCWEKFEGFSYGAWCTEPKGHSGSHCCTYDTLDLFHELRRAANAVLSEADREILRAELAAVGEQGGAA